MDHPERPPRVYVQHIEHVQDVQSPGIGDAGADIGNDQADQARQALASREPTLYGGPPRRSTILVAENGATNRHLMEQILRFAGYTTLSVTNGREALETLQIRHADLMLVDISMPVLDGYAMLALLREQPTHIAMPVVAVTAHATLEDRQRALNAGFTEYLTKPFRPRDLLRMVERLLARD